MKLIAYHTSSRYAKRIFVKLFSYWKWKKSANKKKMKTSVYTRVQFTDCITITCYGLWCVRVFSSFSSFCEIHFINRATDCGPSMLHLHHFDNKRVHFLFGLHRVNNTVMSEPICKQSEGGAIIMFQMLDRIRHTRRVGWIRMAFVCIVKC